MNYILIFNAALAFIAPTTGRVNNDIAIALARFLVVHRCRVTITPSLAVELPLQSRRPSLSCRALHHPQFAIARSIAAHHHCALGLSPLCMCRPLQSRSRFAVLRRQGAVGPSLAIEEPLCHPLPSPSRSHCAIPPCRQGAIVPSIAIKEPLCHTLPSRSRRPCRLMTRATRHAPLPSLSSQWLSRYLSSRHHLPSAGTSHCGIAFCASRRQIDDDFENHADAAVQCGAHRPIKHNQGFTQSQWMPPLG